MSYILDALRRADAERSRGAVPGLHVQNVPEDPEPSARNFAPLVWAAGGALTVIVAVVVVLVFAPWRGTALADARAPLAPAPELNTAARDSTVPGALQGETPSPHPGGLDPAALPVQPPMAGGESSANRRGVEPAPAHPPSAGPSTFDAPSADTLPAVAPPGRASPALPPRLADRLAAGRVATLESRRDAGTAFQPGTGSRPSAAPADAPVEHYGPAANVATPAPAAPPGRRAAVTNINDLPPATRAQLPRLVVGGAIYSDSATTRMVILNGQVFHEGDKPAPDTVLEQIRLKTAVVNFRGQRYEIAF